MVITINEKMSELEGPAKEFFLKKKVMIIMRMKGKRQRRQTEG